MARTKKSRGGTPFELKSGNSPNKFLGGLVGKAMGGLGKAALGGIGKLLGGKKLFGGRSNNQGNTRFNPNMLMGMGGQFSSNDGGSADATQAALNAQQNVPLTKKKTKFKKK